MTALAETNEKNKSKPSVSAASHAPAKILYPGAATLLVAVIGCFTAWGIAADLTTPMVSGFKRIFDMSSFQASLVQMAYYGAYFLLAIPAALINSRWGYKAGMVSGLALASLGAFGFWPASQVMTYGAFLAALFAIAAGCSLLETSASPYVISLGPEETSTRRLNLAQAFNPLGTNIGVLIASTLILPKLDTPVNLADVSPETERAIRAEQLRAVTGPYIGLGVLLAVILVIIFIQKAPPTAPTDDGARPASPLTTLWRSKRYRYGVIAQFFDVAAQVCCWTYIIQYTQQALNGSLQLGSQMLQISLIVFLIARFLMTAVIARIRATKVMAVLGAVAVGLCIYASLRPDITGVIAIISASFCLSLMFPTIYGVALSGLGDATKFGAAGLVMAIVGGAIMPMVQGRVMDATSAATSFIVPAVCFAMVTAYAIYDLRAPAQTVTAAATPETASDAAPAGTASKRKAQS
ncbi:L-fucose:H+ symporter permease [Actinomyces succiniciruminis]|uniref:L-fucose permease n=1 Tax=Actinomyces succiniciruminis TaxID=1522002 RepID=A0A1L7RN39_9ACTO|nr:L-fucose:H+ symporter permease [Actinomyces succiniciruminis]CED90888.1 L-fucose permease [Actinomyces succiniciruminis]